MAGFVPRRSDRKTMTSRTRLAVVAIGIVIATIFALRFDSYRGSKAPASAVTITEKAGVFRCDGCNLLLISIDTLRADRLGCYGYERDTSPTLDELAAESIIFRDVLAQAATTAPSHRSLFTGRYVFQHRDVSPKPPTMAGLLAESGYRTAAFVDGGQMSRAFGLAEGFETFFESGGVHRQGAQVGGGLEVLNSELVEWLRKHGDQKFFAFLHTYDVHCPYTPPEPYRSMFTDGYEPDFEVEGRCGGSYFNRLKLGAEDFAYLSALYDGGVRYVDSKIAEILAEIHRLGLAEKTIVVITSDHGESLGERWKVGHRRVWDVQLKVPLIMHLPTGHHRVVEEPVQGVDLLPTVLSMLGIRTLDNLPGRDLSRLFDADLPPEGRVRFGEGIDIPESTIRLDSRWSLLLVDGEPAGLFDLARDPAEEENLIAARPDVSSKLFEAYRGLQVPASEPIGLPEGLDRETRERLESLGYLEDRE